MDFTVTNIVDKYTWRKDLKILTSTETGVPQLATFGYNMRTKAIRPLRVHCHKNKLEVLVVTSGRLCMAAGGKEYTVSGGEAFIAYPDEVHSSGEQNDTPQKHYWFQIDMKNSQPFMGLDPKRGEALKSGLLAINKRTVKVDAGSVELLKKSFSLFSSGDELDKIKACSLFVCFLTDFVKSASHLPEEQCSPKIQLAADYILKNIENNICLEDVVANCGMSLCGFKLKFAREMGITPRNYINLKKTEYAKQKIKNEPDIKITDLAIDLGFSSSNYFSVVFKKFAGVSPTEYARGCALNRTTEKEN